MSHEISTSKIPQLNSQAQYQIWSSEVTATAMLGGFYNALVGKNKTTSTDADMLDKIEQRELKAIGLILKTVSEIIREELRNLGHKVTVTADETTTTEIEPESAHGMWEHLKAKFSKKIEQ